MDLLLVSVGAGYNNTGVTLIDLKTQQVSQFLPLKESWNGLAFSRDGKRLFVAGGDSGVIHVFGYANGQATPAAPVTVVDPESRPTFIAVGAAETGRFSQLGALPVKKPIVSAYRPASSKRTVARSTIVSSGFHCFVGHQPIPGS